MTEENTERTRVYKPSEVAKMFRVDMRTIYAMIERGELPGIKIGRVVRIPAGAVDALLSRGSSGMAKPR